MNCENRGAIFSEKVFEKLKPGLSTSQEPDMNFETSVLDSTAFYLRKTDEMNNRIIAAPNAAARKTLVEEKNRLIGKYETELGLDETRPGPTPDLPVFDLRGMDELITREAELENAPQVKKAAFSLKKTIGLSLAMALFMFTVGLISVQVMSYTKEIRPVLTAGEERRAQVEKIIASIGDAQEIKTETSITNLQDKLGLIREAVSVLASGATDEELEEQVNQRREIVKTRLATLHREQNS